MPITVPGDDTAGGLILMSELTNYLRMTRTSDDDDIALIGMAKAISDQIEKHCDRKFLLASYTEYYDIEEEGQDELNVNQWPITDAAKDTFKVYSVSWSLGVADETELDKDDDYFVYPDEGVIRFTLARTGGHKRIKVVYQAGYLTFNDVPHEIRHIIKTWCGRAWFEHKGKLGMKSQSNAAGGTVTFNSPALSEADMKLLSNYARPDI